MKTDIEITNVENIVFPICNKVKGDLLILGNFNGACGNLMNGRIDYSHINDAVKTNNELIIKTLQKGKRIYIIGGKETITYYHKVVKFFNDCHMFEASKDYELRKKYHASNSTKVFKQIFNVETDFENNDYFESLKQMTFDNIIINPPYSGTLYLDFFEHCLDVLDNGGKMTIISPATWLINVRNNNKFGKNVKKCDFAQFERIKDRLKGRIKSIVIENLNKEFNTMQFTPFATTTIDMSKTYDTIDCMICGEHKAIDSIYDCNLIGKYETIWSILDKVHTFGDMMDSHITKENKGEGMWYAKYSEIIGSNTLGCASTTNRVGISYDSDTLWINNFVKGYYLTAYHYFENSIKNAPHCAYDRGKHLTDKIANNIYGTKAELENWKHFIFNNKLPLFINIVMTIDQNNCSKEYLPWLVDKQYTDEEINEKFGFTEEEIKLIDSTLKKYERNSPWFKRYMCGKDAVSDEEVNNFIEDISK